MEELIKTFHIDAKLLLAQVVNFAVVVGVLYKFAYKPLLKHMKEREAVIKRGLEDALKAQQQIEEADKIREEKITQAKKEAREIVEEAQKIAEKNKESLLARTKEEAEKIIKKAKEEIASQKSMAVKEAKKEVGELVILLVEKIIKEDIAPEKKEELLKKTLREI